MPVPLFSLEQSGRDCAKASPMASYSIFLRFSPPWPLGWLPARFLPGGGRPLSPEHAPSGTKSEKAPQDFAPARLLSYPDALVQSVSSACQGMLSICAFVVLFAALLALCGEYQLFYRLARLFPLSPAATGALESLFSGLLEVTSGCAAAAQCSGFLPLVVIPFLTSFSGLSVIFQIIHIFSGIKLPMRGFVLSRFLHGPLTALIAFALLRLFPDFVRSMETGKKAMDSFACVTDITLQSSAHSLWGMVFLVFSMAFFLLSVTGIPEKGKSKGR